VASLAASTSPAGKVLSFIAALPQLMYYVLWCQWSCAADLCLLAAALAGAAACRAWRLQVGACCCRQPAGAPCSRPGAAECPAWLSACSPQLRPPLAQTRGLQHGKADRYSKRHTCQGIRLQVGGSSVTATAAVSCCRAGWCMRWWCSASVHATC